MRSLRETILTARTKLTAILAAKLDSGLDLDEVLVDLLTRQSDVTWT